MLPLEPDWNEIRRAVGLFLAPEAALELRIPETHRATVSGYYNDPDALVRDAALWCGKGPGIYITLNPVQPDLLARACNRIKEYAKHTTQDGDILARRWLPIDFDFERPAGISASEAEHQAALQRAADCRGWLQEQGWPSLITADSGNGGHLLAPIDLPNDPESLELVAGCLAALAARFSDAQVKVDLTTKNASRIWKLYGSPVCKGDPLPQRPHRIARILELPPLYFTPRELLERLAAQAPAPEPVRRTVSAPRPLIPTAGKPADRGDYRTLDVVSWFQFHGHYGRPIDGHRHAVLCPWVEEHSDHRGATASDTVIWTGEGGWPTFHCSHSHCQGRTLQDVLELWGDGDSFCSESFQSPATWPTTIRPSGSPEGAPEEAPPHRIPEHARTASLTEQAGALRRQGLEAEEITEALWAINLRRCEPPLERAAVEQIAAGVCQYEPYEATSWRVMGDTSAFTGIDPLRKIGTDPPRYEATVRGKPIQLSALELAEWKRFKFACLTRLNYLPELPRPDHPDDKTPPQTRWEREFVAPAIERMERCGQFEAAPEDASVYGAAWHDIRAFLGGAVPVKETLEDAFDGKLAQVEGHFVFRGRALRQWLSQWQTVRVQPDELWDILRQKGGVNGSIRTKKGYAWVWKLPTHVIEEVEAELMELTSP